MKKKILFLCVLTLLLLMLTACGGADFDVNFIINGEIYSVVNTSGNETIKLPENPTKEGYEFEGWYWDNGEWEKPFTVNSLLNTPLAADMNVYAKFKHSECSYTQETIVAPTCTEKGYTLLECECGKSEKTNYVLTTDHTYSEWTIRREATAVIKGLKERICTVCGEIFQEKFSLSLQVDPSLTITNTSNANSFITLTPLAPTLGDDSQSIYDSSAFKSVEIDIEQHSATLFFDELPDGLTQEDINTTIIIKTMEDNNVLTPDFDISKITVKVKNDKGEYEPVPLPSFPSEPDTPELETDDNLVTNNSDKFVP